MTRYNVPKMSCGHCTAAIEKEILNADDLAQVRCDLTAHMVEVETDLDQAAVLAAIKAAGFDATAA